MSRAMQTAPTITLDGLYADRAAKPTASLIFTSANYRASAADGAFA
jgi:hypothetical protein